MATMYGVNIVCGLASIAPCSNIEAMEYSPLVLQTLHPRLQPSLHTPKRRILQTPTLHFFLNPLSPRTAPSSGTTNTVPVKRYLRTKDLVSSNSPQTASISLLLHAAKCNTRRFPDFRRLDDLRAVYGFAGARARWVACRWRRAGRW
jgi:hypothetical protein